MTSFPILKPIILQMGCWPSGAAAGERNFKAQSHVHSKSRNRLVSGRIEMQSAVFYNSKQLQRNIGNSPRLNRLAKILEWTETMQDQIADEIDSGGIDEAEYESE